MPSTVISASPLQALMSGASAIPGLLEEINACKSMATSETASTIEKAFTALVELATGLALNQQPGSESEHPRWYVARATNDSCIWFPDITMANYLTHSWAFWIICITTIRQLRADYPCLMGKQIQVNGHRPESQHVTKQLIEISVRILQSMDFLIQDNMKLYGVASAALPFQTAYDYLEMTDKEGPCARICKQALDKVAQKGYRELLFNEGHAFGYPPAAA